MAAGVATGGAAALAGGAARRHWLLSGNGEAASSSSGRCCSCYGRVVLAAVQARHHGLLHSRLLQAEALLRRALLHVVQCELASCKCDRAPAPQPRMPFGLNQIAQTSSGSDSYGPVRRPRPQRAEPSFNELRREALARARGGLIC